MDYNRIFLAHALARKTALLFGSSGFGKSATIYAFAEKFGYRVVERRTCYIEPIEITIPRMVEEEKVIDFWPARWLKDLSSKDVPKTVLFLDEFNRPASMQTFSMFTELLLDRTINGIKIHDNVLILGACNISTEDAGVMEIPDAVLKRCTNLKFVPSQTDILKNMRQQLAREVLKLQPKLIETPGVAEFNLNSNPRQTDAVCELAEIKYDFGKKDEAGNPVLEYVLGEHELGVVAQGRIGMEKGALLASTINDIRRKIEYRLPRECIPKNFEKISECELEGQTLEVVSMLKDNAENPKRAKHVADYLLRYATPETCRAMREANFMFTYPSDECPVDKNGNFFKDARPNSPTHGQDYTKKGQTWYIPALWIQKLTLKAAAQ